MPRPEHPTLSPERVLHNARFTYLPTLLSRPDAAVKAEGSILRLSRLTVLRRLARLIRITTGSATIDPQTTRTGIRGRRSH